MGVFSTGAVAPISIEVTSALGTDLGNPLVQAFLAGASVSDNVDTNLTVLNDAPAVLPLGTTQVTFWAYDAAGNLGQAQSSITVRTGQSGTIGKAACLIGQGGVWWLAFLPWALLGLAWHHRSRVG
ncbi:MAG: HYR domain-containing protein [Mariprofundaceae bacterium]